MASTTSQNLYSSDVTIAAGGAYTTDSQAYDVSDVDTIALQLRATGDNASSAGKVQAKIVAMVHDVYSTEVFDIIEVTLNGANQVVSPPFLLNVRGIKAIKVTELVNTDATYGVSGVNVAVGKTII